MQPAHDTRRHYTYADYLSWDEPPRHELIDGVPYAMAPAPGLIHQELVGGLYRQLDAARGEDPCRVFVAPVDVRLPRGDEADEAVDTVVQPDLLVVCDPARLDARGVRGAPDLVVEVVSPSSAFHDHRRKRELYERAGVPEYWLVDPLERVLHIYRRDAAGHYGKPEVAELKGQTPVPVPPGATIDWDALMARLEGLPG